MDVDTGDRRNCHDMVLLRCTERLRARLKRDDEPGQSTTVLGDWYGNVIRLGRRQALLFISERSRLPVLMPAREVRRLADALPAAVGEMLAAVGAHPVGSARECAAMTPMAIARTQSRSLLGSMNDFASMAQYIVVYQAPGLSMLELARELAKSPILPLDSKSAIELTREILGPAPGLTTNRHEDPGSGQDRM